MLFEEYKFICTIKTEAHMDTFKGSNLRSAFGYALRQVVCIFKKRECHTCTLKQRCLYHTFFGDEITPHPYILVPPRNFKSYIPESSPFEFTLILFGKVNYELPYLIYAIKRMGEIGIGRKVRGKRGKFQIDDILVKEKSIYDSSKGIIDLREEPQDIHLAPPPTPSDSPKEIKVELVTPLRVKHRNHFADSLPFHLLARAMLRRISTLMKRFGKGEPKLNYAKLIEKAHKIKTRHTEIYWYDWRRYSSRQRSNMYMGGLMGSIIYSGDLREYIPLLEFSSKVHIGKQTTFGLGKIHWEPLS